MRSLFIGGALACAALLGACNKPAEVPSNDPTAPAAKAFPLTPAVIAMRWQLLNPEVNAFTFRDTDKVFEYRPVGHGGPTWDLPRGEPLSLPDYPAFAERTFTNAMLVIKGGKVVFEDYRNRSDAETRFISFSMAKTITALLVGIALGEGKIASLDDPADKYVLLLKGTGYEGVTIRQMLQMRSGVAYEERYDFGDDPSFAGRLHEQAIVLNKMRFADGALETKRANTPGSTFNYSTLETMVLGWVLEQATGQKLEDYTRDRLWQPLGAEGDAFWLADGPPGDGRALNGMGFNARLRDFGRLGLLLLRDGKRGDAQIVPDGWVKQATTMMPTGLPAGQGFPGYGFQIWQVDDQPGAFAAVGLAGQFIYVSPRTDTVIVKLSHYPPAPPPGIEADVVGYFKRIANGN